MDRKEYNQSIGIAAAMFIMEMANTARSVRGENPELAEAMKVEINKIVEATFSLFNLLSFELGMLPVRHEIKDW